MARWAAALAAGGVLTVGAAEWLHWRASRQHIAAGPPPGPGRGTEAVIVLGYPARRNGAAHPMQRWRCQIAARSVDPGRSSRLIFTGAPGKHGHSEAAVMSNYAHDVLGVPAAQIALETEARTTWQNVENTLPLVESVDVIKIASDPLHAARARRYLRTQRPDLAGRIAATADYRFGDHWWLKVPTAGYELVRRAWRLGLRTRRATGMRAGQGAAVQE